MELAYELLLGLAVVDVEVEPLVELLAAREDVGDEEVEEGPELRPEEGNGRVCDGGEGKKKNDDGRGTPFVIVATPRSSHLV